MAKEEYNPDLFAGRIDYLDRIVHWANDPDADDRVYSLISPPGMGKSWLAAAVHQKLRPDNTRLVFLANLSLNPATKQPYDNLIDPQGQQDWLQQAIQYAKILCPDAIHDFDPSLVSETLLSQLVQDLCEQCPQAFAPLLIVDGYDEVPEKERRLLEERFLARFVERTCTRLLLTRRDDLALTNYKLRWLEHEEWLEVLPKNEGDEQVQKRIQTGVAPITKTELASLSAAILPYPWNHPHINTILLDRAWRRRTQDGTVILRRDDLRECLEEIVQPANLSPAGFDILVELTHLADGGGGVLDEFSDLDLRRTMSIDLHDARVIELFSLGIAQETTPRYRVSPGICELVRAWKRLPY